MSSKLSAGPPACSAITSPQFPRSVRTSLKVAPAAAEDALIIIAIEASVVASQGLCGMCGSGMACVGLWWDCVPTRCCGCRHEGRLKSNRQAFVALQSVADEIAIGARQSTLGSAASGSQDWVVDSAVAMIRAGEIRDGSKAFGGAPPFPCLA